MHQNKQKHKARNQNKQKHKHKAQCTKTNTNTKQGTKKTTSEERKGDLRLAQELRSMLGPGCS